jgi:Xaa-Pro aminopeptidase
VGDAVTIDWGVNMNGYNSDLTRVFFLGRIPPRFRMIYEVTFEAQRRAIEAIKPGVKLSDIDAAARDYITECGFGPQFGHALGHGLGMEVHEAPGVSGISKEEVRPGMVFTVEPGIYIPGFGGVRIEDDVLVTKDGCRVLSDFPKDIGDMVI